MFVLTILFMYISTESCIGGEPYYVAQWSDVIRSCPDFENTHFSCEDIELSSSPAPDDDDEGMSLRGKLIFYKDLKDGFSMDLQVFKCTELGDEPMYSARSDFCSSMSNPDTPWHPLVATFNCSSCPIPEDVYSLDDVKISIAFANGVLTYEFVGEYIAKLAVMDNMNMISCHMLSMAIVEKYKNEE